jgi:hypothetical protein
MATTEKFYPYCYKCAMYKTGKLCAECSVEWQWRNMKEKGWDRPPKHFKELYDKK